MDYKAAFDSPIRDKLYKILSELGIPAKLARLCTMKHIKRCQSNDVKDKITPYNILFSILLFVKLGCNVQAKSRIKVSNSLLMLMISISLVMA